MERLSDRQPSQRERLVLEKGRNITVTPNFILVEDIIAKVESAIRELDIEKAEELRRKISRILQTATPRLMLF